jgi:hypothetical protein
MPGSADPAVKSGAIVQSKTPTRSHENRNRASDPTYRSQDRRPITVESHPLTAFMSWFKTDPTGSSRYSEVTTKKVVTGANAVATSGAPPPAVHYPHFFSTAKPQFDPADNRV